MHLASRFACTSSQSFLVIGYGSKKRSCAYKMCTGRHEKTKLVNWKYLALSAVKKNEYTPPIQNVYRRENTKLVNWK